MNFAQQRNVKILKILMQEQIQTQKLSSEITDSFYHESHLIHRLVTVKYVTFFSKKTGDLRAYIEMILQYIFGIFYYHTCNLSHPSITIYNLYRHLLEPFHTISDKS